MRTFIIAEAGVNHNGSMATAKELIDVAKRAGADAVKFQTFKTENVMSRSAPKAEYQVSSTGASETQFEMVKKLEFGTDDFLELHRYCGEKKIEFLSTPFDLESVDLLAGRIGVRLLKVPSGEVTNAPYLLKVARAKLPLIVSTGMCTTTDIEKALKVIAFGTLNPESNPIRSFLDQPLTSTEREMLKEKVTLLHCTTEYPAPFEDTNLNAMVTMRELFGMRVGFSDHTAGISAPIAAVALGAEVIEKHFTIDRGMPGPDHRASLEPQELVQMVRSIREVEMALGTGVKAPSPSEKKNMDIARRSLVALKPVRRGEKFTTQNLGIKRPGSGKSPFDYWEYLGREASRDFEQDELIQ